MKKKWRLPEKELRLTEKKLEPPESRPTKDYGRTSPTLYLSIFLSSSRPWYYFWAHSNGTSCTRSYPVEILHFLILASFFHFRFSLLLEHCHFGYIFSFFFLSFSILGVIYLFITSLNRSWYYFWAHFRLVDFHFGTDKITFDHVYDGEVKAEVWRWWN